MKNIFILFITLISASPLFSQEDDGCFNFSANVEVVDGEWAGHIKSRKTYGPFKTQNACMKKSYELRNSADGPTYWWGRYQVTSADGCKSCESKSDKNKTPDSEKLEDDYLGEIIDDAFSKWFISIISPINKPNVLTLTSMFPNNKFFQQALGAFGSSLGTISLVQGYVDLFETTSIASLEKAMNIIDVNRSEWEEFLQGSGHFLLKHGSKVNNYIIQTHGLEESELSYSNNDLARTAFTMAAASIPVDSEKAYIASGMLGLAGVISAGLGEEETSKQLLNSALSILNQTLEDPSGVTLHHLIKESEELFNLDLTTSTKTKTVTPLATKSRSNNESPTSTRKSTKQTNPSKVNNNNQILPGEYDIIYSSQHTDLSLVKSRTEDITCGDYAVAKRTITSSPLTLEVSNNNITISQTTTTAHPAYECNFSSVTSRHQAWKMELLFKATGRLNNNKTTLSGILTTKSAGSSVTTTFISGSNTTDIPPINKTTSHNGIKLTVLQDGKIQMDSVNENGTKQSAIYKKRGS